MPDELAWETLDRAVAYTCEGFDVVTDRVRLPDGAEVPFDYVSEPESVVVLPLTDDGEVVLVEEWRQAVGRMNRSLPAGNVESVDADVAAAAHRELAEEAGCAAGSLTHLTTVEPANGFADAVFHYYVARDCTATAAGEQDADEFIRTTTTPFEDLLAAARTGELRDGRAMLGVLYYAMFER
jgi:ADP-ribose pyrophosphatase